MLSRPCPAQRRAPSLSTRLPPSLPRGASPEAAAAAASSAQLGPARPAAPRPAPGAARRHAAHLARTQRRRPAPLRACARRRREGRGPPRRAWRRAEGGGRRRRSCGAERGGRAEGRRWSPLRREVSPGAGRRLQAAALGAGGEGVLLGPPGRTGRRRAAAAGTGRGLVLRRVNGSRKREWRSAPEGCWVYLRHT